MVEGSGSRDALEIACVLEVQELRAARQGPRPLPPRCSCKPAGSSSPLYQKGNARRIGDYEETDIERGVVCDEISCATKDDMFCPGGN